MSDGSGSSRVTRSGTPHRPSIASPCVRRAPLAKPRRRRVFVTVPIKSWLKRKDVKDPKIVATLTEPAPKDNVNHASVMIDPPALGKDVWVARILTENATLVAVVQQWAARLGLERSRRGDRVRPHARGAGKARAAARGRVVPRLRRAQNKRAAMKRRSIKDGTGLFKLKALAVKQHARDCTRHGERVR